MASYKKQREVGKRFARVCDSSVSRHVTFYQPASNEPMVFMEASKLFVSWMTGSKCPRKLVRLLSVVETARRPFGARVPAIRLANVFAEAERLYPECGNAVVNLLYFVRGFTATNWEKVLQVSARDVSFVETVGTYCLIGAIDGNPEWGYLFLDSFANCPAFTAKLRRAFLVEFRAALAAFEG